MADRITLNMTGVETSEWRSGFQYALERVSDIVAPIRNDHADVMRIKAEIYDLMVTIKRRM